MEVADAVRLVAPAVRPRGGTWADLGAGSGIFTRALAALLGAGGHVIAVEREPRAVAELDRLARDRASGMASITALRGDFTTPLALPPLDGVLLANALHFVPGDAQAAVLRDLSTALRPGGRLLLVEYDDRPASRWVPYPVSRARFAELARTLGLGPPAVVGKRPSAYGGLIYAAFVEMPAREG